MDPKIIFEDESLIIIDKPSGLVVNRCENAPHGTLQDWSAAKLQIPQTADFHSKIDNRDAFIERAGIVHRLDKETSGLLLIAKNPEVFERLQAQFMKRTVKKKYTTLVHGKVVPQVLTIKAPVGRLPWNRRLFGVIADGRDAVTTAQVGQYYKLGQNFYSLLTVTPLTGRTHQIRVHLQHSGYPVVGDPLYVNSAILKEDRLFCPRLFLHAGVLEFIHPVSGKWRKWESRLPADLLSVIKKLQPVA